MLKTNELVTINMKKEVSAERLNKDKPTEDGAKIESAFCMDEGDEGFIALCINFNIKLI